MKTNAYLRFSLLIPFVVWAVCLLIFLVVSAVQIDNPVSDESSTFGMILALVSMFYVFGIIIWIFPYLLLALILFFWSFIAQTRTALKVFALSPVAMTLLTLATVNIIMLGTADGGSFLSEPGVIDQGFVGMNVMATVFALVWGYICVGIGYGIYKLLQRRGIIKDEMPAPALSPVPEIS